MWKRPARYSCTSRQALDSRTAGLCPKTQRSGSEKPTRDPPRRSAFEFVKMYCHATTPDADSLLHASLRPKLRYWSAKCDVAGQIRKLSCPHKYVCVRSRCPAARVNLRLDCIRLQLCATLRSEYSLLVGDPHSVYFYRGIAFFTTLGTRFQRFCCICL